MVTIEKEIPKDIYDRAVKNNNKLCKEDEEKVFSNSELYGYGIYGTYVKIIDGRYMVIAKRGETCD